MLCITFYSKNEEDGDWSLCTIQCHCLSLKKWQRGMRIFDIQFHMIHFSVQIHGLEMDKFSKHSFERIRKCIRKVIEVDEILGMLGYIETT